jgi:anti-sigma B factor antagonist
MTNNGKRSSDHPRSQQSAGTGSERGGSVSEPVKAGGLAITRVHQNDGLVLALRGELDLASAPLLERELWDAESSSPGRIVVDLSGLQFVDSTGLHVLLGAHRRARENDRQLLLRRGPRAVHRLFEITGTLDAFAFES